MNNDTLDLFGIPGVGSTIEGDAYESYLRQKAQAAAAPQNPGMEMGGVPQPIPPIGSANGPVSVSPTTWEGGTPGIPQVPASMANSLPNGLPVSPPIPPSRPTSFAPNNAGQGFNHFKAKVNTTPQPLQTPQAAPAPVATPSPTHSQHQAGLIDNMLRAFGVQGGLGGIINGFGQGIGHIGQDIGHGLDGIFNQHAQAPQAAPAAYQASAQPQATTPTGQPPAQTQNPLEGILNAIFNQHAASQAAPAGDSVFGNSQPMDHGQTPNGY